MDKTLSKSATKEAVAKQSAKTDLRETVMTIVYAVLIAGVVRSAAFEPFNIPSESMLPTLLVGDYLFVSKYAYGYSRHSLPFSPPLFQGRIFSETVERGDVVVFKLPRDNKTDYIKRIVGLPGDRMQMRGGVLFINDAPVRRERIEDYVHYDDNGSVYRIPQFMETLPNGVSYRTLDLTPAGRSDNTRQFVVPEGHYFAMGDNRDNSLDSRVPASIGVGFVPEENLVGRAETIFYSTDGSARFWEFWRWIPAARFERFFQSVN